MNLYKLSQTVVDGYDTYSDCVVAAPNEAIAATMAPDYDGSFRTIPMEGNIYDWPNDPGHIKVELLGKAKAHMPQCMICASFHAG